MKKRAFGLIMMIMLLSMMLTMLPMGALAAPAEGLPPMDVAPLENGDCPHCNLCGPNQICCLYCDCTCNAECDCDDCECEFVCDCEPVVPCGIVMPGADEPHIAFIMGTSPTTLSPTSNITRQEVAVMFARIMCRYARAANWNDNIPFTDVALIPSWARVSVATTASAGFIHGFGDGTFRPGDQVTRLQFLVVVARFMSMPAPSGQVPANFDDIPPWGQDYVERVWHLYPYQFAPGGVFDWSGNLTRDEAVVTIIRMLGRTPTNIPADLPWPFTDVPDTHWSWEYWVEAATTHCVANFAGAVCEWEDCNEWHDFPAREFWDYILSYHPITDQTRMDRHLAQLRDIIDCCSDVPVPPDIICDYCGGFICIHCDRCYHCCQGEGEYCELNCDCEPCECIVECPCPCTCDFITVTLIVQNGRTGLYATYTRYVQVRYGELIPEGSIPTYYPARRGFYFVGWYRGAYPDFEEAAHPAYEDPVTEPLTFTARFNYLYHRITFIVEEGGVHEGIIYRDERDGWRGTPLLQPPSTEEMPGWEFIGWFIVVDGDYVEVDLDDFSDVITNEDYDLRQSHTFIARFEQLPQLTFWLECRYRDQVGDVVVTVCNGRGGCIRISTACQDAQRHERVYLEGTATGDITLSIGGVPFANDHPEVDVRINHELWTESGFVPGIVVTVRGGVYIAEDSSFVVEVTRDGITRELTIYLIACEPVEPGDCECCPICCDCEDECTCEVDCCTCEEPGDCDCCPICCDCEDECTCEEDCCTCEEYITFTVTFVLNGGTYAGNQALLVQTVLQGANAQALSANPTRTGFTFAGWTPTLNLTNVTYNRTFTAQWTANVPPNGGGIITQPPVTPPVVDDDEEYPDDEVPLAPPVSPYHHAYIIGYPDGTVRPNSNITRAEVATIFFRLLCDDYRVTIWSQTNPFPDVVLQDWFNNAISTLANADFLFGYPDGNFRPNQAMTRAEFSALLVRVVNGANGTVGDTSFTDVAGHWAENYIYAAYALGWVQGFGDGTFRPDRFITRAEVAALVNRALNRLPEYPTDLLEDMVTWPDNMNPNAWYYLYIQEATNSHEHEMKECGTRETWVELLTPREWWRLERPDSNPNIFTGYYIGRDLGAID